LTSALARPIRSDLAGEAGALAFYDWPAPEVAALGTVVLVQAHCFAAMYHEIFNDPERDQVLTVLKAWLLTRFSA
jgi:hypothetical protein